MNELLYKIPANTPREEIIRQLKEHPEVRFVSLVGIDMAGNDTDEKIPVRIFIEDIEKFYNGTFFYHSRGKTCRFACGTCGYARLCQA